MVNPFACRPHVLELNRVKRLYRGGMGLDRWQNVGEGKDGYLSEEFLISTIRYIGPGVARNEGISMTSFRGREISLTDMIGEGEKDFLGKQYSGNTGGHLGVLARVGDSVERLIIQAHPTEAFARNYLRVSFGKTEAWYIIDTRGEYGYCYAGLRKGTARADFETAFHTGNSEAMLEVMHKIIFQKGDLILIPSGMIHAMGAGTTFLEFHEPCDYTMRYEKNYSGKTISEKELHYGLGVERLLECMDDTTYSDAEIKSLVNKQPVMVSRKPGGTVEELLSYDDNPCFAIRRIMINGVLEVPLIPDSHCILATVSGEVCLMWEDQEVQVGQGRGVVVPAGVKCLQAAGNGTEVLAGYPFLAEHQ